jgi:hypothetical protein
MSSVTDLDKLFLKEAGPFCPVRSSLNKRAYSQTSVSPMYHNIIRAIERFDFIAFAASVANYDFLIP